MTDFMVLFQFTDEDGMHRGALFPETYEQARKNTIFLVFGNSAQVQIYKWNNKNEEYEFLEKWRPEQTMKGDYPMKRPINQLTRMRDAFELARLIEQETSNPPTMDEEKRLVKLAHKHYCTLGEIRVQYKLSTTEDEAISKIYLTLAQAEAEAHNNETVKEI